MEFHSLLVGSMSTFMRSVLLPEVVDLNKVSKGL